LRIIFSPIFEAPEGGKASKIGEKIMSYYTGSHTKFYHRYHVVWVTKYRYKVLKGDMRVRIREIIRQTCSELGVQIVKGVLSCDHVHMFLSIPPHVAVSTVMQRIKGRTSRKVQMEFPEWRCCMGQASSVNKCFSHDHGYP
jgi:putative transposase